MYFAQSALPWSGEPAHGGAAHAAGLRGVGHQPPRRLRAVPAGAPARSRGAGPRAVRPRHPGRPRRTAQGEAAEVVSQLLSC